MSHTPNAIPAPARKLLFFLPAFHGGGAERSCLTLLAPLARLDYAITLVVAQRQGELLTEIPTGIAVIYLDKARTYQVLLPLTRVLRAVRPDVIISSLERNNMAAIAARALACPQTALILRQDSVLAHLPPATRWLYRRMLPRADAMVAVSAGAARELRQNRLAVTVIYNPAIRPELPDLAARTLPAVMDDDPPFFVGVGRLAPEKDFATLIRAFARVRQAQPARLLILGTGPLRGALEAQTQALGIDGDVIFTGFVSNPFPYIAGARALVLSSRYEGLGNVLVEALALRTPAISTDCPYGPAEVLDHGRYGKLVPIGDDVALAEAMAEALAGSRQPDAPESWLAQFTPDFAAARYAEVIESVLAVR